MRRVSTLVFAGVFIGALCSFAAITSRLYPSAPLTPPSSSTSLGMQIFGQPAGSGGYLSKLPTVAVNPLAYNRVFSLHDATSRYGAFEVRQALQSAPAANGLISLSGSPRYTDPVLIGSTAVAPAPDKSGGVATGPSPAATALSPASSQSVAALSGVASAGLVDDTPSAFDSRMQDSSMSVSMPIRVGALTLRNITSTANFSEAPSSNAIAHTYTWTAGTNFEVQAKQRTLNVNLNTDYGHINTGSVASFTYDGNSSVSAIADLQAANPALFASTTGSAPLDLTSHSIGGGLALPLNRRVTLGLQYGAQRVTGAYGLASTPNLDASKYSYLGNVTFALRPNTALTLSARQYHYQDNLVPSNNYYQTRADLNFTVKL